METHGVCLEAVLVAKLASRPTIPVSHSLHRPPFPPDMHPDIECGSGRARHPECLSGESQGGPRGTRSLTDEKPGSQGSAAVLGELTSPMSHLRSAPEDGAPERCLNCLSLKECLWAQFMQWYSGDTCVPGPVLGVCHPLGNRAESTLPSGKLHPQVD